MDLLKDNIERILSIDYGIKRVGIAISDPLKMFSIPLTTFQNDNKLWNNLNDLLGKYNFTNIIIGYPLSDDGSKSEFTDLVEKFADDFEKKFKKKVELVDERYSSKIAWEHIVEGVASKKKRRNKALIDMNAAAVILEDYLRNH
ncbi:MAG: Holliday junction resolvase RuvX [Ignavibacteriae bacterium]|nr:Holliday junction resolvase RuvX [Ignavibacteriota bacterium]MCB9207119.1 Holliday junction resolvase RuvX [Ignavibacteriales bacterium]MCB9209958.1 Holliday junction resolvase RuvX [Ignavibacteriales bacterium]MCB9218657.1 Holliday junction resolvase RuvX [Ignavibacteriales bacterium]MCB9259337.1 Holliday junction resolvase RuvX [Ignavibacteriales bacterium]